MRVAPEIVWTIDGKTRERLDERLLPLLDGIATSASLAAAVVACGISYRAAWGLLRSYESRFGAPLVLLERGRGATLTPAGERLLAAHKRALRDLAPTLPTLAVDVGGRTRGARPPMLPLRITASHDPALIALMESLRAGGVIVPHLSTMGSLQALHEFAGGGSDVAGFHVPVDGCRGFDRQPFLRSVSARRDRLLRFVDRDQGLILPRGNPAQIRSLRDIAAKGKRFVNRQPLSGTRLLIDQLLAEDGIDPGRLVGYHREEFTHAAVAATVASGGADVGFGLRAAAAEYRLSFVPLVSERYFLAVRARELTAPAIARLTTALASPAFNRIVRTLPGYRTEAAGTVAGIDAIKASSATVGVDHA